MEIKNRLTAIMDVNELNELIVSSHYSIVVTDGKWFFVSEFEAGYDEELSEKIDELHPDWNETQKDIYYIFHVIPDKRFTFVRELYVDIVSLKVILIGE